MKKNISKPEVSVEGIASAYSICRIIFAQCEAGMKLTGAPRKLKRELKKRHKESYNFMKKHDWVNGLVELKNQSYRTIYRHELKALVETPRKEMAKTCEKHDKDVNEIVLGLVQVQRMYEYLTGEDLDGKKIHEGYFDNEE